MQRSATLSQFFSWLGHGHFHLLTALYVTVVLALEKAWHLPYGDLINLWWVGALLLGAGAPLAGWLGDRWSTLGMMIMYFLGSGLATIAAGLAPSPLALGIALGALGLFGSIFHPVGMSWLMRTALRPGFSVGVFGIFGSAGTACAGIVAGGLVVLFGWRTALILPGAACLLTGIALIACRRLGWIVDHLVDLTPANDGLMPRKRDVMRAFWVLSVTVVCSGMIYSSTQTVLPKLFETRVGDFVGSSTLGPGLLFTVIYLASAAFQIVGGWVADRFALRTAYLFFFALQIPLLYLAGSIGGLPVVAVTLLMVLFNSGSQPAENLLLNRYTPERWRATAFGAKFVLAFGVAPLSVKLVAWTYGATGDFHWLFVALAGFAALVIASALLLPADRPARPAAQIAAAE